MAASLLADPAPRSAISDRGCAAMRRRTASDRLPSADQPQWTARTSQAPRRSEAGLIRGRIDGQCVSEQVVGGAVEVVTTSVIAPSRSRVGVAEGVLHVLKRGTEAQ